MYESVDISRIAVGVADDGIAQFDFVGDERDCVVVEGVAAVEWTNHRTAVDHDLAREVDGAERSGEPHFAHGTTVNLADEALCEGVHKVDVCAVGTYGEIYVVFLRRHISLDYGPCVVAVVGYGVDINLALLGVPVHLCVQHTHSSVFEQEVIDGEVGVGS